MEAQTFSSPSTAPPSPSPPNARKGARKKFQHPEPKATSCAPEAFLTIRQVAARLGVHPSTVYGLCERGELRHLRVSNAIRVDPSDLSAFL
ncbi:MAG TPA: helix-turn-helix domain-containing protein, partial [Myxococcaceae bacterium]|nr:helix-turn-helix domain-containing protein [Myxococcaceae bacterium]